MQLVLEATSVASFIDKLLEGYSVPSNLIIYWSSRDHFTTTLKVENAALWHFDSLKKKPVNLSRLKFYEIVTGNHDCIFILVPSSREVSSITDAGQPSSSCSTACNDQPNLQSILFQSAQKLAVPIVCHNKPTESSNETGVHTFKTVANDLIPTSIALPLSQTALKETTHVHVTESDGTLHHTRAPTPGTFINIIVHLAYTWLFSVQVHQFFCIKIISDPSQCSTACNLVIPFSLPLTQLL